MSQTEEMRRLIRLVEGEHLREIGRVGRALGAAALGLSALAGGASTTAAQPAPQAQSATAQAQRITLQNHMQLTYNWFKSLPDDVKEKALSNRDIGNPVNYIQKMQEVSSQSKDDIIDHWITSVEDIAGQQNGPVLYRQTSNERMAARTASLDAQNQRDDAKFKAELERGAGDLRNADQQLGKMRGIVNKLSSPQR